jgi:hypothetical protein
MTGTVPTATTTNVTRGFRWSEVPPDRGSGATLLAKRAAPAPNLGPIADFTGKFSGNGLNTIFRPQNFAASPTPLPNPAQGPNDNILELNLTAETLEFSDAIGSIPNRGFVQGDIFLNGVPYVQRIKDISDPAQPVDIHFEPGVWLAVPPTSAPLEGPTLARMASIPHGTTIEAQGVSFVVPGGPFIQPVDITPFPIGNPGNRIRFPSQTVTDDNTFRIPQVLKPFVTAGTITQEILDNPNLVVDRRAKAQNITSTTVIFITTKPDPVFGGGTDNIAFLRGDRDAVAPNADAAQMTAIFWIETVAEQITLPAAYTPGQPMIVDGGGAAGDPVPSFAVTSSSPIAAGTQIDVTYPQIQYTQTVLLNFNNLSWPHVSVATLVPDDPVPVSL